MFAIIDTCGKQYRVSEGDTVVLDRLDAEEGSEVTFDRVLLIAGDDVTVGSPTIDGAKVVGKVTSHHKGAKVVTFKYTPRQRTRRRVGFRHSHTTVEITGIQA